MIDRLPYVAAHGLRRALPAADPPDRHDPPQGPEQRRRPRAPATRAARGRSAAPTAATPRCIPTSAPSPTSTAGRPRPRAHGIDLALDLAFQCSPDHPWVTEHPEWFRHRPDGTIQYAENPPKKYEDIYPLDFDDRGLATALWDALLDVVRFWIERGVRVFRVDNPHTKPFAFWEWLIATVHAHGSRT